jgi:hypothetical protein
MKTLSTVLAIVGLFLSTHSSFAGSSHPKKASRSPASSTTPVISLASLEQQVVASSAGRIIYMADVVLSDNSEGIRVQEANGTLLYIAGTWETTPDIVPLFNVICDLTKQWQFAPNATSDLPTAALCIATGTPATPTNVTVTSDTVNTIAGSWTSGGPGTAGYVVGYTEGTQALSCGEATSVGTKTSASISGLRANTTYTFTLCSVNSSGLFSSPFTGAIATK